MIDLSNLLAQAAWKSTVILAAGFAVAWLPARVSAAFRHYCWTVVLSALLALPLAMTFAPKWSVTLPNAPVAASVTSAVAAPAPAAPSAPARRKGNPLAWIYAAGVAAVAIRFVAGAMRTRRLLDGSTPLSRLGVPRRVRVVESPHAPVPLVWGIVRPVIALPAASRHWSPDRLRAVLLHELIHVQRRDLLAQVVAQAACCLYWFHPLAWIAARQQRREGERACDDAVLGRGIGAAEYAGHLVDLVRGLTVEAPAMAEASDFEGRVRALLDRGRNRAPLGRGLAIAGAVAAMALILPVASMTSFAQSGRGALAGIVTDPSGARVPGVSVVVTNLDGSNSETAVADAAGEFGFRSIPPGKYRLEVKARGFKVSRTEVMVAAGNAILAPVQLELGEMSETVAVTGKRTGPAPAAAPRAGTPQRIPIGGNVQVSKLLRQPRPVYPEDLQRQGITGTVMIKAVVGKDGRLINPRVVNTDVHPMLAQAALDSVSQWLYEPSKLNGQPVETVTTIEIAFNLDQ
jgi:TonB family protein